MIAADDTTILKHPDATQTGRRGNAGPLCQLDIGHPAISLQIAEDLPVDIIEFDFSVSSHLFSIRFLRRWAKPPRKVKHPAASPPIGLLIRILIRMDG
jgi:hypothetical protein